MDIETITRILKQQYVGMKVICHSNEDDPLWSGVIRDITSPCPLRSSGRYCQLSPS